LSAKTRTVARLRLMPGAAGRGIAITRGQWEIVEAIRQLGFCGSSTEYVIAYLLQTAIADRVALVGKAGA
jgi:hypothetical protein